MATVTGAGPDVGRVPPSDAIYLPLKGLLMDGRYSDLWSSSAAVASSKYTAPSVGTELDDCPAACWRVANPLSQETSTGAVELPEDDPDIFARFLQFLYTGNYDDGEYAVLGLPAFTTTMSPEEAREELDKAPGGFVTDKTDVLQLPAFLDRGLAATKANKRPDPYIEYAETETLEPEEDNSGSESEEYDPKHPISLFTSLRVYVMADKFDVPGLKLLARHRFYHSATAHFETFEQFPNVVDELYETTSPDDRFMREIPCWLRQPGTVWSDHGQDGASHAHASRLCS
ncbi:Uncharacterized protein TPAR_07091 [Tolypocladium paradoxum]|uniref:BTB domain-containing protein n=1 Tax=Tolypocladium paradoxum TaxID=94208 RepID=A0A2S4KR69_9HYPO|nr:Uncharacterized protein TPAR_07091 [Tolypocladium paradoxum]